MPAPASPVPARRSRLERILINSWEYRHLRFWAVYRIVLGIILIFFGLLTLSYRAFGWAALFLVPGAVAVTFGCWQLTIARSAEA
jgi:uncharacterized membrane protein HdeD (DUF308 family)